MAIRKLTGMERKKMRALAGSLLFGGEHRDTVRTEIVHWLVDRGWNPVPAMIRAREIADAVAGVREL